jgi:hypothetical protein
VLAEATRLLGSRGAEAICAREPLIDLETPKTADLDLLVFADVDALLPERLVLDPHRFAHNRIDLIWLPVASLDDPMALAGNGLVAHRLASSRLVHARDAQGMEEKIAAVHTRLFDPIPQHQRLTGFCEMGFLAVREVGVTWDFPAMALFWLHMAHAACIAVILDAGHGFCPNVYTRPMGYVRKATALLQVDLEEPFRRALFLETPLEALIERVRRVHALVDKQFPEPAWPVAMRATTRYEYRYFRDRAELDWRIAAAQEMADRGDLAAAVFYLRFWAYSLARLPMVHQRALEGQDVSFVRPERAIRPELERLCPYILEDLSEILAPHGLGRTEVEASLAHLDSLRTHALGYAAARGITIASPRPWLPFQPRPKQGTGKTIIPSEGTQTGRQQPEQGDGYE